MSSLSGPSAMDGAAIVRDDQGSCGGITRRRPHGRNSGAIRFILLGALSLAGIGVGLRVATASQSPSPSILGAAAVPTSAPVLPGTPADGVLTLVIPPGPPRTSNLADGDIRCPTSSS